MSPAPTKADVVSSVPPPAPKPRGASPSTRSPPRMLKSSSVSGRHNPIAMADNSLLQAPGGDEQEQLSRLASSYAPLHTFTLPNGENRHYQQQYAQIYFTRLALLKPTLEEIAEAEWGDFELGNTKVEHVLRVLDVRQGQLCWIVGTIYLDMPLKPNVLDDIAAEQAIAVPPPRGKYIGEDGEEQIFIEDESGRLRMIGAALKTQMLVTGCIIAVMGTETANGDFEVIDLRLPDLAPQPQRWERDETETVKVNGSAKRKKDAGKTRPKGGKIGLISGLGITGDVADVLKIDMLVEYLSGELGTPGDEGESSKISRLIIAGGSVVTGSVQDAKEILAGKKQKKTYGYDATAYNPAPTIHLDRFLSQLLPTIPVTLMPGESDPANVALPQQPIHPAMLPHARAYGTPMNTEEPGWFDSVSNPWEGDIDGWRFLGTGGQPIDDIFRYVQGDDRIDMMESILRWRNNAPTAPDTLWVYPFHGRDPFIMDECPHVYFVGNQPEFDTSVIEGPNGQSVRLIAIPQFYETGQIVLLDSETLETEVVAVEVLEAAGNS